MGKKENFPEFISDSYRSFPLVFFFFFLGGLVLSAGIALIIYKVNYDADSKILVEREEEILSVNQLLINEHLQRLEDDILYLSSLQRTKDFVRSNYNPSYDPSVLFISFLKRKKRYTKISLIDRSGKVILQETGFSPVREYTGSDIEKESYRFFDTLMARRSTGVYFSPFIFETPYAMPGLSVGKVMTDGRGKEKAGLVLEYESSGLFNLLYKSMHYSMGSVFFTDNSGFLIPVNEAENPEKEVLRRMLHSKTWHDAKSHSEGHILTDAGMISFINVRLSKNNTDTGWKLLSFITSRKMDSYFSSVREKRNVYFLFLSGVSFILAFFFAFYRVRRRIVQKELLLLRTAFSQSANAIVITDPDGSIKFGNNAFQKITGYTLDELIGNNPRVLKSGYHSKEFYHTLWKTILSGNVWRGVFLNKRKDGTTFWERATITPVKSRKGVVSYYMAVKEDISEIKKRENELRKERELLELAKIDAENAKREAEKADRLKSVFLANISHEIRTPMNAILGFSRILFESEADRARQEQLRIILDSGEHLLMLINDILDFSQIESGKVELVSVKIRIPDIINSVVMLLKQKTDTKNIELRTNIKDIPDVLIGDENRIRQILINLVSNAIKFTNRGYVSLDASWNGEILSVAVKDTGIGIPPDKQSLIFEPFEQQDSTTFKKYGGTGLGLTISRRYAERMGGRLTVSSKPGEGSCFTLELPLKICTDALPLSESRHNKILPLFIRWKSRMKGNRTMEDILNGAVQKLPRQLTEIYFSAVNENVSQLRRFVHALKGSTGNLKMIEVYEKLEKLDSFLNMNNPDMKKIFPLCEDLYYLGLRVGDEYTFHREDPYKIEELEVVDDIRILTADDDESNRKVIEAFLEYDGMRTDFAANGQEVLEKLGKNIYDVLVMDIQMPVLDGMETIQRIRHKKAYDNLYVIAVTGSADEEKGKMYFQAGFNDYLTKPVERNLLVSKIMKGKRISGTEHHVSQEIIDRLSESVNIFNRKHIMSIADTIESDGNSPLSSVVARRLRVIARAFDLEALQQLIEELKEERV